MRLKFGNRSKSFLSSADSTSASASSSSPVASPPTSPGLSTSSSSLSGLSSSGPPSARLVHVPSDPFSDAFSSQPSSFSFFSPALADDAPAFGNFSQQGLRILIIGTGFAGLSAAIACARQGFTVTVFERTAGLSQHGDSILFSSAASRLFHRWGVGREMWEKNNAKGGAERWEFRRGREGEVVHEEDLSGFSKQYGAPLLQGRRAGYLGSLGTEARLLGVSIRLESEVSGYLDSEDEPAVVLKSGEIVRGDVVLVADGVHSPARDLLAPHDRPAAPKRPSGYSIHRGVASGALLRQDKRVAHLLDGTIRTWLGKDSHLCFYPMENGRSLAVTFTHRDSSLSSSLNWRDKRSVSDLLTHLSPDEWDPTVLRALEYFPSVLHWPVMVETPAEEWISRGGKICFIGDSVHAMMPTSFQGGSQAVEDAATIALCLSLAGGDSLGVGLACQVYEALRRPRVAEAQKLGKLQQNIWHDFASSSLPTLSSTFSSLSISSSSPSSLPTTLCLRPLSFSLYAHDAERFCLDNFVAFAAAVDPSFRVRDERRTEAARKAGLELSGGMRKER
ncbi:hypothetical protein JCM8547_006090 [Rhodosporidiobolus lusitaniae]